MDGDASLWTPAWLVPRRLLIAALDLLLPQQCVGCQLPGAPVCASCARSLQAPARRSVPTPAPAGFPPTWAVTAYDGVVRDMVVAHKEEGRRDLAPALSAALAVSLQAAATAAAAAANRVGPTGADRLGPCVAGRVGPTVASLGGGSPRPVLVVPVPSRRASRRQRGDDPTGRIARDAVVRVSSLGRTARPQAAPAPPPVRLHQVLHHTRGVADQAGLDARARGANLAGALGSADLPRWAGPQPAVVVVDDVVTTGATLAEAARALRAAGAGLVVAAVIAATARRSPDRPHRPGRLVSAAPDD